MWNNDNLHLRIFSMLNRLLTACFCLVMCSSASDQFLYASDKMDDVTSDKFDLFAIKDRLTKKAYPLAFADSLKKAFEVDNQHPLREFPQSQFAGVTEDLVYEVTWGFIRGGYGILSLKPGRRANTLELSTYAITHHMVGALYKVRDFVNSTVDERGWYPNFFEEHLREGRKYRANRWYVYDHAQGRVHASKSKHRSDSVPEFVHSYVSGFYYFRTQPWDVGDTVYVNVFVEGKTYRMYYVCHKRETIELDGKPIRCLRVQPYLKTKTMVFAKGDKVTIWFTDDEYRIPVSVRAKIIFGSIRARLIFGKRAGIE
ncbi:MAG: DUF3108 domain-containing protein [Chitinivibrionales bacterium]|nr:DUF3108 domain-containing protein [Chitinivibrionales bacterium]